ncbi:MAG: hypothetical protein ACFFCW_39260 [Candidatus Hodarchaeota archaeon]
MTEPTAISFFTVLLHLLTFALGFFTAIFAEPIRRRLFRPELKLNFFEKPDCISPTPEVIAGKEHQAFYIRVEVTTTTRRMARGCRAYLVNIEKKNEETREFEPTVYCDSIQLAWACKRTDEERYQGIDISNGVRQFLDLFSTRDDIPIFIPKTLVWPYRYNDLLRQEGVLRFTVQVSAEEADPKFIKLDLDWKGHWKDFKVSKNC